ncbi:EamA family transporter [Chitinophaga nivalis]|uniref:EamA family transporter n=1 Tax=Chitinophaga nivalis TaxID=2991709 RepID=A0ABT3IIQ8_9BACT|nr:EamA family transporter [Chitinophaga nivalis]MCW3466481.1 EamA family transporter [Chitinophaga nivalis]MCW3483828.1 EamA family transporter [Chitinophaga nivalis]
MWWLYALLSAGFAALTAIFAKIGMADIPSNLATAIRTVIILIMVWTIVLVKGEYKGVGQISRQGLLMLALSGVATGCSWLFYFRALQVGKVSQVAPVDKLSIALTIVLSAIFLHEAITWKTAIGALLILSGTLVLILK